MRLHRSRSARGTWALILSLVVTAILSFLPTSSHAAVDWNEGFEYADNTALKATWSSSCTSAQHASVMEISTARRFSGSKSLKLTYIGANPALTCFIDRYFPVTETLYTRVYVYLDGFSGNDTGSKMFFVGQGNLYPNFWTLFIHSTNTLSIILQGAVITGSASLLQSGTIPSGRWVCLEERYTMNTPGVANGIVQTWVDGVQHHNRTDLLLRSSSSSTKMSYTRLYRQHGLGTIYFDDYAVSRSGRIGCSGSAPASDTTAPQTPAGVTIK